MKARIVLPALVLVLLSAVAVAQRSDTQIRNDLQRRIGTVNVAVDNGVVTLTGTVPELSQKLSVENVARRTVGVRQVVNQIRVVPARPVSDAAIASAVRSRISENLNEAEARAITVSVNGGVVTLTGTLTGSYPKVVAGTLATFVSGVTDVRNQITVRPTETRTDAEILADIRTRYAQNAVIPAERVNVTVTSGIVSLTGTVSSFVQAEQAENVARFVPGVVDVRNNLFVSAA